MSIVLEYLDSSSVVSAIKSVILKLGRMKLLFAPGFATSLSPVVDLTLSLKMCASMPEAPIAFITKF